MLLGLRNKLDLVLLCGPWLYLWIPLQCRNLTEGSSFNNLNVSTVNSWNFTASFQVKQGCSFRAFNESYFYGEYSDFAQEYSKLPESFENILSASCSASQLGLKVRRCGSGWEAPTSNPLTSAGTLSKIGGYHMARCV